MTKAPGADLTFSSPEAGVFRSTMLAGCRALDADELRLLADELHDCARAGRPHLYGIEAYTRAVDDAPIFDRRL